MRAALAADVRLGALPVSELVKAHPELDSVPHLEMLGPDRRVAVAGRARSMGYDPIPDLLKVHCPVLVVLAENDANVPVDESIRRFETVAAARPAGQFHIEVIAGATHLFRREGAGPASDLPREPATADDYLTGYLDLMADWIAAKSGA